ncbi:MAG: alanine racemase [Gammaproteobacteria bacterium]|nr:alanine racemase [Gammaproteobacteria bacterium]MBT8150367.1 alanine racemase [Gammaproteobacteria bacterium]NNM11415.1 DSD1 family PLP-dependent enzyme [Pseudomonadales bacterium]
MTSQAAYFEGLDSALKSAGIYQPVLLLDVDRLNQNIQTLLSHLPTGMAYRIVTKSLPVPNLLAHIRKKTGTERLMTFNLPMLLGLAQEMPGAKQLLGKPLPAKACHDFLKQAPVDAAKNVSWLIDTPERLHAYDNVAKDAGVPVNIVIELDVGLHRGGFAPGSELHNAFSQLRENNRLTFQGFMGYEPHLASVPKALGWRARATKRAWGTYQQAIALAHNFFSESHMASIIRNTAGSPTYRLYKNTDIANEVSVGSALVKPTGFDTELLKPYVPASFIATPVLKSVGAMRLPELTMASCAGRLLSPGSAQSFFIHGGKWMADPVHPPGLRYNKIVGRSSNQEMLNGPKCVNLVPDDFVFLRPQQSEAVFLQFGDLAVIQHGEVIGRWPTFPVST